jgi:hypothetical protein
MIRGAAILYSETPEAFMAVSSFLLERRPTVKMVETRTAMGRPILINHGKEWI